jgi:hypothetical protein
MYSRIALRSISRSDQPLPGNRLTSLPPRGRLPAMGSGRDTGMQGNPGQDKGSRFFLHSIRCESASIRSRLFVNLGSENAS